MPDVLIRNVPAEDLTRLDADAEHAGLTRAEYLRRMIADRRGTPSRRLTRADLEAFANATEDLGDPEVMRGASG
ncbi:MAG: antitoxin [Bifidobacteriaceae bacterium]|jgi:hypothetical protein|nr:antitoxin [Bifidobacteriaceae bacterium]